MNPGKTNYPRQLESCRVLSLDGGGLKGIFSAAVLAAFEQDHSIRIQDYFDLIVGTSTGGLIALGLGLGLSPINMLEFYVGKGPIIFPQQRLKRRLGSIRQCTRNKLDPAPLYDALREVFGPETKLGASSCRLVLPSFDLQRNVPVLLKTAHAYNLKRDCQYPAWQVGAATSAAPTYFPAINFGLGRLVDGGVWANNPSLVGLVEAVEVLGASREKVSILSIGTSVETKIWPDSLDNGGKIQWASNISDLLIEAQGAAANNQCQLLLPQANWVRINCAVPPGFYEMDRLSATSLRTFAAGLSRDFSDRVRGQFFEPGRVPAFKPFAALP